MSQHKRILADENSQVPHTPAPLQRRSSSFVNSFGTPLTNTPLQTLSQTSSFEFVDAFTPIPKRRKLRKITAEDIPNSRNVGMVQDAAAERMRDEEQEKKQLEDKEKKEDENRLNKALRLIKGVGYPTLHTFLKALLTTKDEYRSSQESSHCRF